MDHSHRLLSSHLLSLKSRRIAHLDLTCSLPLTFALKSQNLLRVASQSHISIPKNKVSHRWSIPVPKPSNDRFIAPSGTFILRVGIITGDFISKSGIVTPSSYAKYSPLNECWSISALHYTGATKPLVLHFTNLAVTWHRTTGRLNPSISSFAVSSRPIRVFHSSCSTIYLTRPITLSRIQSFFRLYP